MGLTIDTATWVAPEATIKLQVVCPRDWQTCDSFLDLTIRETTKQTEMKLHRLYALRRCKLVTLPLTRYSKRGIWSWRMLPYIRCCLESILSYWPVVQDVGGKQSILHNYQHLGVNTTKQKSVTPKYPSDLNYHRSSTLHGRLTLQTICLPDWTQVAHQIIDRNGCSTNPCLICRIVWKLTQAPPHQNQYMSTLLTSTPWRIWHCLN